MPGVALGQTVNYKLDISSFPVFLFNSQVPVLHGFGLVNPR